MVIKMIFCKRSLKEISAFIATAAASPTVRLTRCSSGHPCPRRGWNPLPARVGQTIPSLPTSPAETVVAGFGEVCKKEWVQMNENVLSVRRKALLEYTGPCKGCIPGWGTAESWCIPLPRSPRREAPQREGTWKPGDQEGHLGAGCPRQSDF